MTITAVTDLVSNSNSQATAAASSSAAKATSTLNLDFAQYLKILTTQLQNQDPTNATDPNQFTQELVQLGSVQQQITTNQDLTQLVSAQTTSTLATGSGYIGNYVAAPSGTETFPLQSASSEFGYTLASAAESTIVNISNSAGKIVAQLQGGTAAGSNYVAWNGMAADGTTQEPDGIYTFSVAAVDGQGNSIKSTNPIAMFRVTSVQSNSDGTLQLLAGALSLSTGDVTGLYSPSSLPNLVFAAPYTGTPTSS